MVSCPSARSWPDAIAPLPRFRGGGPPEVNMASNGHSRWSSISIQPDLRDELRECVDESNSSTYDEYLREHLEVDLDEA